MQVGTGKSILNGIAIGKLKLYKKKNTTISAAEVADRATKVRVGCSFIYYFYRKFP